jgi:hypothetical protein
MANQAEQPPNEEHTTQSKQDTSDESSVSTTATDTSTVKSAPSSFPKSKKKKHKKSSKKSKTKSPGLTEAEQDLYNTHADQIRQNALQLLSAEVSPTSNRYRSYHDSTPAATTNFASSDNASGIGSLPPWTATQSSYGVNDTLSVSQVASMAFNCIAQCLTEGYRAASNYYSETSGGSSGGGGYDHNYAKVDSNVGEMPGGRNGSYQDTGYQQKMDRGLSSAPAAVNQSSGQGSTERMNLPQAGEVNVKGEFATVSYSYQRGNKS